MMKRLFRRRNIYVLVTACLVLVLWTFIQVKAGQEKVSEFGKYQGYSEVLYDGHSRHSDYLSLSDGTLLAYDLILPTNDGMTVTNPLPVLFKYTPYLRAFTIFDKNGHNIIAPLFNLGWKNNVMLWVRHKLYERGHLMDALFRDPWLEEMVKHGYAVIVVERPGTGASFGVMDPSFEVGAQEVDEILNWIVAQEWSDGNIGMYGDSWEAQIQFAAASTGNPHLKAIFPVSSSLDNYSAIVYPGGIYNKTFGSFFSWSNTFLNTESIITPVDRDDARLLLAQAMAAREGATVGEKSTEFFSQFAYRDSTNDVGEMIWTTNFAIYPLIERINRSGIPVYMTNGWYDLFTRDMFLMYANLTSPRRLTVRPLDHSQVSNNQFDLDLGAEAHRWFDYWLKGIENGIMDEPPINYYVQGTTDEKAWQTAEAWPPSDVNPKPYYFAEGKTDSVASINDGFLNPIPTSDIFAHDSYSVDYSTTSGEYSRWYAINWGRDYPNMRANDEKGLTYTTSPLEDDLQIIGHPVAHIWLSTAAPDLDVFVYLEYVDKWGRSTYITEGQLRASHRNLGDAPFANLGLPYHRHYRSELAAIPSGQPVELVFDLLPTAYRVKAGYQIRITATFADAQNFDTPILNPAPEVQVLRSSPHNSRVVLPLVP